MQNFMQYGAIPTTVQLDRPGTTFIAGEDLDNTVGGTGSNGVGKTTLLDALVYCLYDRPISNISKDNLINWINKKNMMVSVDFDKNKDNYVIVRCRKMKAGAAGNYTHIYENGVDITPAGAEHINEEIVKILGIPYELFVRIVAFSAIHIPFFDLKVRHPSEANQTDIIEELFNLKTLSAKAESLRLVIKDSELSMKTQLERHNQLDKELERHTKQVQSAQRRVDDWTLSHDAEIGRVHHQIANLKQIDVAQQKIILTELEKLEEQVEATMTDKEHWDNIKIESNKVITEKKHEIKHLDGGKCPYCKQGFEVSQTKRDAIDTTLESALEQLKEANEKVKIVDTTLRQLSSEYKRTKANLTVRNLEELLQLDNSIKQLENKLVELERSINPYTEALNELNAVVLDKKDMTVLNKIKTNLDHQTFLLKLLTKKDSFVRKALLNKNIPYLNKRLQSYLAELGLNFSVEFTHEMTANITQFGHQADFGNLSNGKKSRVNLALSFAFRDVLQSMHDHVNICLLDEVLDVGLDDIGVQAAAKMLKRKARDEKLALYIISHRNELNSAFDRKMIVQLSEGFSSIRYEDE